jgi:phage shock protein C
MDTRLARSDSDKIMGGVCGGLARYFGIDSTIVRLTFVLSVLLGGVSPLIYLVLWIVMPRDSAYVPSPPPALTVQDVTGEWQYDPYTGERVKK